MPHAVDPIILVLADGREARFLLTMGGLKRLKERLGAKNLGELLNRDETDAVTILWEALLGKEGLTEATFADLLPAHVRTVFETIARLLGAELQPPPVAPFPPAARPSAADQ
jgi:hypothetical protein